MANHGAEPGWNLDNSYSRLPSVFYSLVNPEPVPSSKLVILNERLAASLGLDAAALQSDEAVAIFAGNQVPPQAVPLAQAYAGHQFGHFTMLGDGRAVLIGEQITPQGERLDIQLKGSGRTPYSRRGDGRAALGPMLREYIISEAMHALGIPTTRSLAVVKTGQPVVRETMLPGAILTRVAASHIRVGTFEYASNRATVEELRTLADYTRRRHFPHLDQADSNYLPFLQEVIKRQAALVAKWQLVGFIHGVMNTDNMTLSGETIDYGPCAFMDAYNPATVFSSIDLYGRYAYENQPQMAQWNLARLAEALLPVLHANQEQAVQIAQDALSHFTEQYHNYWLAGMRAKLGLSTAEADDLALVGDLLSIMQKNHADFTNTFRSLSSGRAEDSVLSGVPEYTKWYEHWQKRLSREQPGANSPQELMQRSNPAFIPRNHRVEEALEAAVQHDNYSVMERLLEVLRNPYVYSCELAEYSKPAGHSDRPYRTFCGT